MLLRLKILQQPEPVSLLSLYLSKAGVIGTSAAHIPSTGPRPGREKLDDTFRGQSGREQLSMDDTKWPSLCAQIRDEKNPDKLWDLVDQLNQTLDVREKALRGSKTRKELSRSSHAPEDST